jgi:hypothetical protein
MTAREPFVHRFCLFKSAIPWIQPSVGLSTVKVCKLWIWNNKFKKIPVGARFFAHVQTGPGSHPVSCTMGTGSFPGVKRPGRGADHAPLS